MGEDRLSPKPTGALVCVEEGPRVGRDEVATTRLLGHAQHRGNVHDGDEGSGQEPDPSGTPSHPQHEHRGRERPDAESDCAAQGRRRVIERREDEEERQIRRSEHRDGLGYAQMPPRPRRECDEHAEGRGDTGTRRD